MYSTILMFMRRDTLSCNNKRSWRVSPILWLRQREAKQHENRTFERSSRGRTERGPPLPSEGLRSRRGLAWLIAWTRFIMQLRYFQFKIVVNPHHDCWLLYCRITGLCRQREIHDPYERH